MITLRVFQAVKIRGTSSKAAVHNRSSEPHVNSIFESEDRIMETLNMNFLLIWLNVTKIVSLTDFDMVKSLVEYSSKYMCK